MTVGKSSLDFALERSRLFPGVAKTALLAGPQGAIAAVPDGVLVETRDSWTVKALLETLAALSAGFDLTYFAWADSPFLDPALAQRLAQRHLSYAAEYSYADGWPYGLAPELLSPGTAAILAKIAGDGVGGPVGRDALFSVIQKDINAFDIETEIAPVDLRCHRLNLCADSKRNLLLLRRFMEQNAGEIPDATAVERIIAEKQEILRTLPAFYPIQVYGGCPQSCAWCLWPQISGPVTERRDYMDERDFESLLDNIVGFSGDAVIDLSLWGELSLHPHKMNLIEMVIRRPELALIIETSGIGWKNEELERCAELALEAAQNAALQAAQKTAPCRISPLPPLSWIVSLDTADPARYKEIRGAGFAEANDCAQKLLSLFPTNAYVQAVRTAGAEDDIERFYRSWKEAASGTNVIIQKYDDFCGALPKRQASDLSPVQRKPCWHLMRDMPILLDGTVPACRQECRLAAAPKQRIWGNALAEPLNVIWERGQRLYADQCGAQYDALCAGCDEYYTYNF